MAKVGSAGIFAPPLDRVRLLITAKNETLTKVEWGSFSKKDFENFPKALKVSVKTIFAKLSSSWLVQSSKAELSLALSLIISTSTTTRTQPG